jgi:hypothetical protein
LLSLIPHLVLTASLTLSDRPVMVLVRDQVSSSHDTSSYRLTLGPEATDIRLFIGGGDAMGLSVSASSRLRAERGEMAAGEWSWW